MTRVRCYAGASYPERPVAFTPPPLAPPSTSGEGKWLAVVELLRQARTPEGLVFEVLAEDGRRYRLEWDEEKDDWTVMIEDGRIGRKPDNNLPKERTQ